MEIDDLILVITSKIRPIYTKWLNIRRNPTDFSKSDICRKIRRTTDTVIVLFGVLPYIINLRLSKYFVTFETTIWRLWELGFSRDFPVREDSPSDVPGSLVDWQPR